MPRIILALISLILFAPLAAPSLAADQEPPGSVIGTVVDASGKPAEGVIVTLQQAATKMRDAFTATTNKDGKFTLEKIPAGTYNLRANTSDARNVAVKEVDVSSKSVTDAGTLKLAPKRR